MRHNNSIRVMVAFLILACVMPLHAHADDIVIDEDVWVVLLAEPGNHLEKAHENFLKKDFRAAAAEMKKAAAYCRIEAKRATDETRKGLVASGKELEKLADEVKSGSVDAVKVVNATFARAYHALGKHHYLKATESWTKKEAKHVGHALHASASYVEKGFESAGQKVDSGVHKTLDEARDLSGDLISGSGKLGEKVGSSIEACGKQTELLGKRVSGK